MTEANIKTGNPIVDAISKINISGNIIPEIWYHTIVNHKQKTNLLSIAILSDIVYWYRPTEEHSEDGTTISYKKKFGWLIKAVRENYQPQSKPPVRSNSFMNFEQREHADNYYAQLERKMLLGNTLQNSGSLELSGDS